MSKIALLFPGQGAQTVGMGKSLCDRLPAARDLFNRAADILGYDLAQLCFEGPEEKLNSTVHSQPALFVTSLAALELLREEAPDVLGAVHAVAGLSLGEYTALVFAGAMDFDSGLRLVQQRGQAMQDAADAVPSGMIGVLGLERDQVEQLCDRAAEGETLRIANLLCPGNIVVSGEKGACERIAKLAEEVGAMRTIPLAVAGAFHTPLMQAAVERLSAALAEVKMVPPRVPVISNVDAQPHTDPEEIRELLVQQVVKPVLWEDSMRRFIGEGVAGDPIDQFYEVGPGRVLRGLLKRIHRKVPCENVTG